MSQGAERPPVPDGPWPDVPVDGPETVAEKRLLASFGGRARAVNLTRVLRLVELLDRADAGSLDDASRREAENLAHQVAGSAGTFGHAAASRDAVAVERYFAPGGGAGLGRRNEEGETVRGTVERLRAEFGA